MSGMGTSSSGAFGSYAWLGNPQMQSVDRGGSREPGGASQKVEERGEAWWGGNEQWHANARIKRSKGQGASGLCHS